MLRQLRIDVVLDRPAHPFYQRSIHTWHLALYLRRADLQLSASGLGLIVNLGTIQERHARRIQPQREASAVDRPLIAGQVTRLGKLQAHVCTRGAGILRGEPHAQAWQGFAFDQLAEMGLCRF